MTIKIEKLYKHYKQKDQIIQILSGVDLEIKTGEIVALLGKSGSGKSTLLSLIAGLDLPDSGKVLINDTDLFKLSDEERARFRGKNIGIVFQQFHLVNHLNAFENISLSLEINNKKDNSLIRQWLDEMGLTERAHHLPSTLSGGEQQRVAIARALIFNPKLILADEPTGNLDNETAKQITKLLFDYVRKLKTTMIFVTHDRELAELADRIVTLKDGRCDF
ncbi:MAG: ABC transporter ATP-binding protein [bacterium]